MRFRRGGSQARGQIIWLFLPVVLAAISAFLPFEDVILHIWYPLIAVAVAIGVLGYDLLGINVTVRRALVYLPLTLVVALLVGAISATISQRTEGSEYGIVDRGDRHRRAGAAASGCAHAGHGSAAVRPAQRPGCRDGPDRQR